MTDLEREVCDLAIKWIDSKFSVEEALIRQKFIHAIRMLKKERRDEKVENLERQSTLRRDEG